MKQMNRLIAHILIFASIILSDYSFGQAPVIEWSKCYGGYDYDAANDIIQTDDGGYLVTGKTMSLTGDVVGLHDDFGAGNDVWLIKLDSLGTLEWQRCLGGSIDEYGYSIEKTFDGGYIIGGTASSDDYDVTGRAYGINEDYWFIKIDSAGSIQWQKCYGGSNEDVLSHIIQTRDSGYIASGYTWSTDGDVTGGHGMDYWIVKIDSVGSLQWENALGGWQKDQAGEVIENSNGHFIITGAAYSNDIDVSGNHGFQDVWLVELDQNGILVNQKCFGGSLSDAGSSMISDGNSGYFISGGTLSNDGDITGNLGGGGDVLWMRIDSIRNIVVLKCVGSSSGGENSSSMIRTRDGNIVLSGSGVDANDSIFQCALGFVDGFIVKLDTAGNMIWNICLGGTRDDVLMSVKETRDGGLIACGFTNSNDGDVTGYHPSCGGLCKDDFWVVKLMSPATTIKEPDALSDFSVNLNPESNTLTINSFSDKNVIVGLQVWDVTGRILLSRNLDFSAEKNSKQVQTGTLNAGVYLVRLATDAGAVVKKIMVQ